MSLSVFTREDSSDIPSFSLNTKIGPPPIRIEFTPQVVCIKLSNLDPSKASGPKG